LETYIYPAAVVSLPARSLNTVTTKALSGENKSILLKAIPFYAVGNRDPSPYQVWLPLKH